MDLYTAGICYLIVGLYLSLMIYWRAVQSGEDLISPWASVLLVIMHAALWPITLFFMVDDVVGE